MKRKMKISIRVDADAHAFLESRAIKWDKSIAAFTEAMILQGIETEKRNESKMTKSEMQERWEAKMIGDEDEDQSPEAIHVREQIANHSPLVIPKEILRAINETDRRAKEKRDAIAKGIEPPTYERSAWDELFGDARLLREANQRQNPDATGGEIAN